MRFLHQPVFSRIDMANIRKIWIAQEKSEKAQILLYFTTIIVIFFFFKSY